MLGKDSGSEGRELFYSSSTWRYANQLRTSFSGFPFFSLSQSFFPSVLIFSFSKSRGAHYKEDLHQAGGDEDLGYIFPCYTTQCPVGKGIFLCTSWAFSLYINQSGKGSMKIAYKHCVAFTSPSAHFQATTVLHRLTGILGKQMGSF